MRRTPPLAACRSSSKPSARAGAQAWMDGYPAFEAARRGSRGMRGGHRPAHLFDPRRPCLLAFGAPHPATALAAPYYCASQLPASLRRPSRAGISRSASSRGRTARRFCTTLRSRQASGQLVDRRLLHLLRGLCARCCHDARRLTASSLAPAGAAGRLAGWCSHGARVLPSAAAALGEHARITLVPLPGVFMMAPPPASPLSCPAPQAFGDHAEISQEAITQFIEEQFAAA